MSCFTRRRATPKQSTRACSGGGAIPRLSPKEYDILRLLVLHASKVLTHRMIMREVWGGAGDVHYLRGPGGNVLTLKVVLDEHRPMR